MPQDKAIPKFSKINWKDSWKRELKNHHIFETLHQELRGEVLKRWKRSLSFADELFDRWDRAAFLGFGEGSSVYDACLIIGDVKVGKNTWIGPYTVLDGRGGLSIGEFCSISAGVQIYSHDTVQWALTGGNAKEERSGTYIGNYCYIAPLSVIAKGIKLGDRCLVGAHSYVNKSLPENSIAFGCPAKIVGEVRLKRRDYVELYFFTNNNEKDDQ